MADTYSELIVKGSFDRVKTFVTGYLAGKGASSSKLFFSRECGVRQEKLPEKIIEWVGIVRDRTHVLIERSLVAGVRSALKKHGPTLGIEFIADQKIGKAVLGFEFTSYSQEHGKRLLRRFRGLPAGIRMLPGYDPREVLDPDAKGPEMYSPRHHYKVSGKGRLEGDLARMIRFREQLEENELIRVGPIRLEIV